ncbi:MAG: flagellar motor switch protein FliN [Deltaproteobacteria bacterium]|nr:flagellar motor switch protein FliN [Deltaproteobacteria bacterium]
MPLSAASIRSTDGPPGAPRLDMFLDVALDVRVELGRARVPIQRLLEVQEGSVLELDKAAGELLDVMVNGRLVARGEAVVVGDRFAVRIIEVVNVDRRATDG